MITSKMIFEDVCEKLENELYTYYPNLLKASLKNVESYIYELSKYIDSMKWRLNNKTFPLNYVYIVKYRSFDEKELKNIINNKFEVNNKNVYYYKTDSLNQRYDLEKQLPILENVLSKWIEIKEVLTKRLRIFDIPLSDFFDPLEPGIKLIQPEETSQITIKKQETNSDIQKESNIKNSKIELRPPNRGELKELCIKFAEELSLTMGEELKRLQIENILSKLIEVGIKSDIGIIRATLNKLGYKKKSY
jgi:hypothetical protein